MSLAQESGCQKTLVSDAYLNGIHHTLTPKFLSYDRTCIIGANVHRSQPPVLQANLVQPFIRQVEAISLVDGGLVPGDLSEPWAGRHVHTGGGGGGRNSTEKFKFKLQEKQYK